MLDHVVQQLESVAMPSLYASRETLEVVGLLRKVMDHWSCVVSQVSYQPAAPELFYGWHGCPACAQLSEFGQQRLNQWHRKELRSRQRRNYECFCARLATCIYLYLAALHWFCPSGFHYCVCCCVVYLLKCVFICLRLLAAGNLMHCVSSSVVHVGLSLILVLITELLQGPQE